MATSTRTPESILYQEAGPQLAVETAPAGTHSQSPKTDALQALLAFSSLQQQIRSRSTEAGKDADTVHKDEFLLYEVLQLVAERALALTSADGVAIALVQKGEIVCRAATGKIAPEVGACLDPRSGLSGICFLSGETVRCDDAENDPRVNVAASRNLHARSMIAVPLRGRRSVIGILEAFSTEAFDFDEGDVNALNLLSEMILGAMKPEEEETLEALSPAPIKMPSSDRYLNGAEMPDRQGAAEFDLFTTTGGENLFDVDLPEDEPAPASEIPSALLRDYEKSPGSRLNAFVISGVVLVAITALSLLIWRLRPASLSTAVRPAVSRKAGIPRSVAQTAYGVVSPKAPLIADLPLPSPISPDDAHRNVLPLLTGVRHWETGDSSTVAIDLQDQVQYEVHRLSSPERIYFDLHDTVLAPGLNGISIDVGNDLLARIRVAQPIAGVARVVLDTKDVSNFSVGLEPNPYRLIIEIRHSSPERRPKASLDLVRPTGTTLPESLTSTSESLSKEDKDLRSRVPHLRIVIDAGHGGWDLGTVGRLGVVEKDLVLEIARKLGQMLHTRMGSDILYTRSEDVYVPLEERAEIANDAQADLFVSIHANNSDYPSARGVETYYTNVLAPANSLEIEKRENATAMTVVPAAPISDVALKERTDLSHHLAASVERSLYAMLSPHNPGVRDRGVKEAGFVVLTATNMPAILAEVSFISSPADEKNLQSSTYRQHIADALYKGIAGYASSSAHVKLASAR